MADGVFLAEFVEVLASRSRASKSEVVVKESTEIGVAVVVCATISTRLQVEMIMASSMPG